ncbi:MAG: hypothetical protein KDD85_10820 [Parvularculaceae bacterium]|nr:hypothetical protein [Parvularculaceae bacterium]
MRAIYFAGAAAAALAVGFGGVEYTRNDPGVPFIDPMSLVRSACGKDPAAALKRRLYFRSIGAAYAASLAESSPAAEPALARTRPVPGVGYDVTTANDKAQSLFNAGLAHVWNFNHGEAVVEFKSAQAEDPDCAMCFWAEAFALGPNINAPMSEEAVAPAFAAMRKAVKLKDKASDKERMLIDALALRYAAEPLADRSALDAAFADAMDKAAVAYPDDDFILALAAEANMDTQPWDYWLADGRTAKGRTDRTISLIETVLARNPHYQPAIHLYIHMTEATTNPYRAEKFADELARLSPSLGHLIHMPSHTYARIGRFRDSIETNVKAVAADENFLENSDPSPLYQYGYYVHNVHFVMTSAQMAGDKDTALAMAAKLDAKLPTEMALAVPFAQPIKVAPYFAMAQFADSADILALEDPGDDAPFIKAAWRYARGEAFARNGEADKARAEAEAISDIIANADLSGLVANLVPAPDVLKIEYLTVTARAAAADGDLDTAIEAMEEAVATQESLNYTEPPYWYYPAKQTLAAFVLRKGDAQRAEQLFIESLGELPNNGWSYAGLAEAYKAQGDKNARKYAEGLMKAAWIGKGKPALERL